MKALPFVSTLFLLFNFLFSLSFVYADSTINSITLINLANGNTVPEYDPIPQGAVLDLTAIGARYLTFRANTNTETLSVTAKLDANTTQMSSKLPFLLCGYSPKGDPYSCDNLYAGSHQLTAIPWSSTNATGSQGQPFVLNFSVINPMDGGTTPPPPSPTPTPTPTPIPSVSPTISPSPTPSPTLSPPPQSTPTPTPTQTPISSNGVKGMWVWTTLKILSNSAEEQLFVTTASQTKLTDVFLYLTAPAYTQQEIGLRRLITKLNQIGIKVWGLEGYRGYFSDSYGPGGLYSAVDQLIAYNRRVATQERFFGFQSDMEPQDGQGSEFKPTFHNGIPSSSLNKTGGGVWYSSQSLDREMLMRDWLTIHQTIKNKLAPEGLKFGAAMPSWTDNYYGEPVKATYLGIQQRITAAMMGILDDYDVMSYNTDPVNASNRVISQLQYANTLPITTRPRVYASVETHRGPGATVSYGDHPTKNKRSAVMTDILKISTILGPNPSFQGVNIHDWEGWRDLAP